MTTLASDYPRAFEKAGIASLPVIASDIIYQGAALGYSGSSGNVRPLVAGDVFAGIAVERCDNSTGAAAERRVNVQRIGVVSLPVSGAAVTDKEKALYASDDATFTLTASTNSYLGRVLDYQTAGFFLVAFDATKPGIGALAALTGGSGGTANGASETVSIGSALTGSTGGTANGAVETQTVITDITGPVGTANGAMETVGATNGADVSGAIMNNFKELTDKLTIQIAINLQISNNLAELQAARVTDAATLLSVKNNLTELETQYNILAAMAKGQ